MDAAKIDSVQLQVWRGDLRGSGATFAVYLEESNDGVIWSQGGATPTAFDPGAGSALFFDYCFQMRWFRLRVELGGSDPMVTCWADGQLR